MRHAVADPAHRRDIGWACRVIAQLVAELLHDGAHPRRVAGSCDGPTLGVAGPYALPPVPALTASMRSRSYSVAVSATGLSVHGYATRCRIVDGEGPQTEGFGISLTAQRPP